MSGALSLPMTAEEHLLLNEVIERQFGLSFSAAKREFLESRLRPRLQALHLRRFIDYYLLLQYDLDSELEHLARLVTNNETYFFREVYQFEGLFGEGAPAASGFPASPALAVSGGEALRLLCAGCSSGEEPYTLNLYARRAAGWLPGLRWTIDAFDIDVDRLRTAKQAIYGSGSLRSATPEQRQAYFAQYGEERWELKRQYRDNVTFAYGNILSPTTFRKPYPYDAVFCRNVLIYFSEAAFHRAIANFAEVLRPGGLLFLGHSESLIGRSDRFETVRLDRCIAYRKVKD
jgi:chemotaxis protein methyltransferase CheR